MKECEVSTLVGHVITDVSVVNVAAKDDMVYLTLEDNKRVVLRLEGDCCSRSYFKDDAELRALVGAGKITSAELRELGALESDTGGDVTRCHALVITTEKGSFTIDWRNDSNGYYDGTLVLLWPEEEPRQ